ncbi:MAG: signal recognition particle-docking protein FtsY [Thermodesulforhabdaceae bacterium]
MIWWPGKKKKEDKESNDKEIQNLDVFPESSSEVTEETQESDTDDQSFHEESKERESFLGRLVRGLQKTREHLSARVERLFKNRQTIDRELFDELEEILITSDVGVGATRTLLDRLSNRVKKEAVQDPSELYRMLEEEIASLVDISADSINLDRASPFVVMVVGVNGVGKTTTIAKLAHFWKTEGKKPLVVAGDTFRAAAIDQLALWAERIGVPVIKQKPGADPSAVAYDALESALSRGYDVVIVDTAGRMHTKSNLMEELKKIRRVMAKKISDAPHETFLVLDATTGQNAYSQVKIFKEEMNISGLILTKLDGTAKGGVVIGICHEFGIPIRFIGVGEGINDLRPFQPDLFARALLKH